MLKAEQKIFSFGKQLYELREMSGYTQEEVSNKVGVARASYSHYENDRVEPDIRTLNALANLFEVTIDTLINYDQPKSLKNPTKLLIHPPDFRSDKLELENHRLREEIRELKSLLRDTVNILIGTE